MYVDGVGTNEFADILIEEFPICKSEGCRMSGQRNRPSCSVPDRGTSVNEVEDMTEVEALRSCGWSADISNSITRDRVSTWYAGCSLNFPAR